MTVPMFEMTTDIAMRGSPTMSAGNLAKEARKAGHNVIEVTLGDMFPKPTRAEKKEWANKLTQLVETTKDQPDYILRTEENEDAYSPGSGLPLLRAVAARTFTRDTGLEATVDNVGIGNGGKGTLNGAFYNGMKAGDVVFVAAPGWPTNYDMFPPGVKLVELATGDGILRADVLKEALKKHPKPAMILINAPNNPTGANYTPAEREEFFKVVNATPGVKVASDDPYGKLVFDRDAYDVKTVIKRGPEEKKLFDDARLSIYRSVSKEYGMAGSRVGFLVTKDKDLLTSLQRWNENKGGGMGVKNQEQAAAALMFGDDYITRSVEGLKEKRAMIMEGVGALQCASMEAPMGTIYGWVDFKGLKGKIVPAAVSDTGKAYTIDTPEKMNHYLVYVAGVCGVPGTPFYATGSDSAGEDWHVRMSFCCPKPELEKVIRQLAEAEQKLESPKNGKTSWSAPEPAGDEPARIVR